MDKKVDYCHSVDLPIAYLVLDLCGPSSRAHRRDQRWPRQLLLLLMLVLLVAMLLLLLLVVGVMKFVLNLVGCVVEQTSILRRRAGRHMSRRPNARLASVYAALFCAIERGP